MDQRAALMQCVCVCAYTESDSDVGASVQHAEVAFTSIQIPLFT